VRRDQILDAAERVLLDRGLRSATVADVVESAGVAKGTLYLYFTSKDDLLAGLRTRYLERYAAALSGRESASARGRIRHLVTRLYAFGIEHHDLHHVLFHEAGFSEADAFTAVRDLITALIDEGVSMGEFAVPDVALTASFIVHGAHGALIDALHDNRRRSGTGAARDLAALVDRVLSASELAAVGPRIRDHPPHNESEAGRER
jgi:AcrR family transcriptional regulator